MNINVLNIRADATFAMGTGHVMRCIALGQAIITMGGAVNFMSHCENKILRSRIKTERFSLFDIFQSPDDKAALQQTLQILNNNFSNNKKKTVKGRTGLF